MSGKSVILAWVDAFNAGDADRVAEFYTESAVNHQVANEPIVGKSAIHLMFTAEFAEADMHCIVENLFEDGDWVILEWRDPKGLRGCGFFQLHNGLIAFQRGYWDKLSFLRANNLPIPN